MLEDLFMLEVVMFGLETCWIGWIFGLEDYWTMLLDWKDKVEVDKKDEDGWKLLCLD